MPRRSIAIVLFASLVLATPLAEAARVDGGSAPEHDARVIVLGLEADDPAVGAELTLALRRAAGGAEGSPSLAAARRAEGCQGNDPECLARVGRSLGAQRLVFGRLRRDGDGYVLELSTLDVEGATVVVHDRFPLTEQQVRPPELDRTADVIAASMLDVGEGTEAAPATVDERPPSLQPDLPPTAAPPRPRPTTPVPPWKPAMFGVAAGLTGVGLVGAITLSFLGAADGKLDREIADAVTGSLVDARLSNDIPPETPRPCDYAAEEIQSGRVRNASVTGACDHRQSVREAAGAVWAATAVLAVTTVVFAALWHRHRHDRRALARRQVALGVGPDADGGVALAGSFRF